MPVTTFKEAQDAFAAKLPGYTRREHQIRLAEFIEQAMADEEHALAQAGTGTGKSFALSIPGIIQALRDGKKVIVATPTRVLQTQYVGDMRRLEEILDVGPWKWAILKGRNAYPCFAKAQQLTSPTPEQKTVQAQMDLLSEPDPVTGRINPALIIDREDFQSLSDEDWKPFSMSSSECPGAKSCPFGDKCFAERAKARANEANLVVTNLAFLLQDLLLRHKTAGNVALLGEIGRIIIDEAHMLPDAATSALEDTMGQGSFAVLSRDVAGYLLQMGGDVAFGEAIEQSGDALWDILTFRYRQFSEEQKTSDPMPLSVNTMIDPEQLGDFFSVLTNAVYAAREEVKATRAYDERGMITRERLMRRLANMMERLENYVLDPPEKTVRWAEMDVQVRRGERRERLYLRSAPIDVGPFLRTALFGEAPVILSSATLAAGKDFSFLAETVGLRPGEYRTYDAGSPFDYPKQALLYVPDKDVPSPDKRTRNEWRPWAHTVAHHLVTRSGGGALLLYTSRSELNEAWNALAGRLRAEGLTVLRQGELPNNELIRVMKQDGNAVLFALRSFFEGVDIQGTALRLVIIDKLPFAPPSDLVYSARCDAINAKHHDNWAFFRFLAIPAMILVLTQAFGRLIRHRSDIGVVAILDSRLHGKRYGKDILGALPPARRTKDIAEAVQFLEAIKGSQQ